VSPLVSPLTVMGLPDPSTVNPLFGSLGLVWSVMVTV
jgi:hypothetical protein